MTTSKMAVSNEPKLLDIVCGKIRLKYYSIRTEQAFADWIKRYILHFDKHYAKDLGAAFYNAPCD